MKTIYYNVLALQVSILISACGPSNQSSPQDTVNKAIKPICSEELVSRLNEVELYRRNYRSIYSYNYLIKALSSNSDIINSFGRSNECIVRDLETNALITINYTYLTNVETTLRDAGRRLIQQECSENTGYKQACEDLRYTFNQ